jgi:hypothetical protein
MIDPADYDAAWAEVAGELTRLRNARTGMPLVTDVVRTRADAFSAFEDGERPSDADMIVIWANTPCDVVDHPVAGRIGPVPFKRSGSHVHRGFFMACGPDVPQGVRLAEGHALDLAPTILSAIGAPVPRHFDGRSLLSFSSEAIAV